MAGSQATFDIQPGTDVAQTLQFRPVAVIVDNYSPYWVYLPDAGRYVPPYTTGGTYPLRYALGARVVWSAPDISGIAQLPLIPTAGLAHLSFSDEALPYTPATAIPNQVFLQSQSFSLAEGDTLDLTAAPLDFLAMGVRVDNPGGTTYALGTTGITAPQWTTAFTVDVLPPFNSITVAPTADPAGRSNTTRGGPVTITFYASQIGNSPGIAMPSPIDYYLANDLVSGFTQLATSTYLLEVSGVTPGNTVYLKSLSIVNPLAAQSYSVYQTSDVTGLPHVVAPLRLDPSSPPFPATLSRPPGGGDYPVSVTHTTPAYLGATPSVTMTPTDGAAGDLLVLYCWRANTADVSAAGWTALSNGSSAYGLCILARIATSAIGSGDVATISTGYADDKWGMIARFPASQSPVTANAAAGASSYSTNTTTAYLSLPTPTVTGGAGVLCPFLLFFHSSSPTCSVTNDTGQIVATSTLGFSPQNMVLMGVVYSISGNTTLNIAFPSALVSYFYTAGALTDTRGMVSPPLGTLLATLPTAPVNVTTTYDLHTILGASASATAANGIVIVGSVGNIGAAHVNLTATLQSA